MANVYNSSSQEPSLLGQQLPAPCNWGGESEKWKGPFEMKICNTDLNTLCSSCCLTIVYYERYVPQTIYKVYQSNVVGVLWDGSNCPCGLNMDDIMIVFDNKLFKTKSQVQKGFWIKNKNTPDNQSDSAYLNSQSPFSHDFYVSGGCYQKDSNGVLVKDNKGFPIECNSDNDYCCRKTQWVTTYGLTGVIQEIQSTNPQGNLIQQNSNQNHQNCPTSCLSKCNDPVYDKLDHFKCFLPQNCTKYDKKISNDNEETFCDLVPNICPGCCFTVNFDYRVTEGCEPEEYHDFTIDNIKYSNQCNDSCQVSIDVLFDAVIDALLTKSDIAPKPENGKCKMNYRFYQNTCWFDHFNEMFNYRTIRQCSDEFNCCFRLYKVCASESNTPTVYTSQQIGTSIPVDVDTCDNYVNPHPCYFLCGEPLQNSIQIIEDINDYDFEVYKNQENLILNTDKIINTNLILEIYDFNGILIKNEVIKNNSFNYFLDNVNNLKYILVLIKENGKVVYSGKFIK